MTIPTLMNNVSNAQFKTGAKKAYSVASQAVMQMQADKGSDVSDYQYSVSNNVPAFKDDFVKYFKVIKDCGYSSCYPAYKALGGASADMTKLDDGQFITADGMFWMINNDASINKLLITIDVNGPDKKPNVFGKDVFMFEIVGSTVYPEGATNTAYPSSSYCDKSSSESHQGLGCTSLIIQDVNYST